MYKASLRRPITITVRGRPFCGDGVHENESVARTEKNEEPLFTTQPLISRWNCLLGLAPQRHPAVSQTERDVPPESPSPFPTSTLRISTYLADSRSSQIPLRVANDLLCRPGLDCGLHAFYTPSVSLQAYQGQAEVSSKLRAHSGSQALPT
jgi:hypothetical protein